MKKEKSYSVSFKCPSKMHDAVEQIMLRHNIDRSSVIRLALYQFTNLMQDDKICKYNINQIVNYLEKQAPRGNKNFGDFCD